jgi:hypothetical protein
MKEPGAVFFALGLLTVVLFGIVGSGTVTRASDRSANVDLDYAQVIFVKAVGQENGLWRFDVTVRHNDEGWDHYADLWQLTDPKSGNVIGERVLAHPHDTEQPFTRSLSNVDIPKEITKVVVRARCNVHGFGGQEVMVDLQVDEGEHFEVIRPQRR